jgi:TPR repeat protein
VTTFSVVLLVAVYAALGIAQACAQGGGASRQRPAELQKLIENVKRRAEAGDAEAQYVYSTLFGADGAKQAATWVLRAAEQGHPKAQARAGVVYDLGAGVEKNPAESLTWLTRAAGNGQKLAQYYLGRKYALGEGVARDAPQATKWLQASAEHGHVLAQYELARLLKSSDRDQALRWFRASAERGYAPAQYELAGLLDRVHPDELRAMLNPGAKVEVQLPPEWLQERAEAKKWYQAAAEGGVPQAQYYTARHTTDQTDALKWYYLVGLHLRRNPFERADFEGTYAQISKLEQSLSPAEREEAERRARKWLSEQPARDKVLELLVDGV